MAWVRFSDYVWDQAGRLWRARYIDMQKAYGDNWSAEVPNLARYVVKPIGCRMDHDGYPVPSDFAPFLDGGAMLPSVQMVMFKDPVLWALHGKFRGEWDGTLILGSDPAWGEVSPSLGTIKVYASSLSIGYVGNSYRRDMDVPNIDPFYLHRKVRLHRRG